LWVNIIIKNAQKALFRLETLEILNRINFTPTILDSSIIPAIGAAPAGGQGQASIHLFTYSELLIFFAPEGLPVYSNGINNKIISAGGAACKFY
jgi:hypothetical protein